MAIRFIRDNNKNDDKNRVKDEVKVKDDCKKEARIAQYSRFSEDWRHFSSQTWQIPSVVMAILGGLFAAASAVHSLTNGAPPERLYTSIIFGAGSAIVISLGFVSVKYRFFHVARSNFLRELEGQLGVTEFPVETQETITHLGEKKMEKYVPRFMLSPRAANFLIWIVFSVGVMLISLTVYFIHLLVIYGL